MARLRKKKNKTTYRKIKFIVCMILIAFICMMSLWIEKCIADSIPKENSVIPEEKKDTTQKMKKEEDLKEYKKIDEEKNLQTNHTIEINKEKKDDIKEQITINHEKQGNKKYNYKEIFYQDVFIGDSITNGLSFYHLLDDKKVIANLGDTISKALMKIDKVLIINPQNIFILFGVNDFKYYKTEEEFIKYYEQLIHELKNKLPNTNIYVQSILPVSSKYEQKNTYVTNEKIENMNILLMNMSEVNDVTYIHIATVIENSNEDLHEGDGIHFRYAFYPVWLNFLMDYTKEDYKNENI
ncbi:GDSL-type esterase/lipase family protein [Anaerophilus nitritogenes]|uniref:GDSL-type esterase/lipase family protein n=1 Tax=Anaerophilus nitritogenes TaxID=2498136 RepID=UPI00101C0E4B|nr:GDSL-type esterase/lipase family protein [Anaerophilus nitritogenes]